jgi:hypothetical protein
VSFLFNTLPSEAQSLASPDYYWKNRRGITVEELRARVREQEREQVRQKAVEAEARAAERLGALKPQQDEQPASAFQAPRPPGSSIRKDSSPVKVHPLF